MRDRFGERWFGGEESYPSRGQWEEAVMRAAWWADKDRGGVGAEDIWEMYWWMRARRELVEALLERFAGEFLLGVEEAMGRV